VSSSTTAPKNRRILAVEDDDELLTMLTHLLGSLGEVQTARDGMEAMDILNGGYPADLVVTDLMMPRMDGLTLARHMKSDSRLSRIPVVMLTAKSSPRDMIEGINAGARHYVTKPFTAADLLAKAQKALAGK
jgi:CheY-like chemotaxis protein